MGKNKDEYFKHFSESLSYKFSLDCYSHYEKMIGCRNKYVKLYNEYLKNQHDFDVVANSKENVFGYIFSISTHFFDELLNNIVLSSYDSAHFSIRRISENFVIFSFLNNNVNSISDFFRQVSMNKHKHIISSEVLRNQLSEEEINKVEEEFNRIKDDIISFFGEGTPLSNRKLEKLEKTLRSNYYWAYRRFDFGENITFKKLCNSIDNADDYDAFSRSSNRVHSNNIFEYTLMMTSDYKEEMYLCHMYCWYMVRYTVRLRENYPTLDFSEIDKALIDLDNKIENIYSKGV